MAPELLLNAYYSKQVDVWPVGMMLYMLFHSGKHPIYRTKLTEVQYKKAVQKPTWIMQDEMNMFAIILLNF